MIINVGRLSGLSTFVVTFIWFFQNKRLPLHSEKAFFSIMQNKTDKGTSLVSKSLPVVNLNSVNRLFSTIKKKYYVSQYAT